MSWVRMAWWGGGGILGSVRARWDHDGQNFGY